jgi:hypothetical protein
MFSGVISIAIRSCGEHLYRDTASSRRALLSALKGITRKEGKKERKKALLPSKLRIQNQERLAIR